MILHQQILMPFSRVSYRVLFFLHRITLHHSYGPSVPPNTPSPKSTAPVQPLDVNIPVLMDTSLMVPAVAASPSVNPTPPSVLQPMMSLQQTQALSPPMNFLHHSSSSVTTTPPSSLIQLSVQNSLSLMDVSTAVMMDSKSDLSLPPQNQTLLVPLQKSPLDDLATPLLQQSPSLVVPVPLVQLVSRPSTLVVPSIPSLSPEP